MSSCNFCGGGSSREHIVPKWLIENCDLYKTKFRIGFGQENQQGELESILQPQPLGGFYTMDICQSCNNGWMSRLENKAQNILDPLIQKSWPSNDKELFQTVFLHSSTIARWLLKTACTFGVKMSVAVPEQICKSLYADIVSEGISVDMAYDEDFGHYMAMSRQWNVWKEDEKITSMQVADRSFRLTWQVHHLVMRVHCFPGCEMTMTKPRFPVRIYPKFRILPDYVEQGIPQRSYHYKTLEQLEHETCYACHRFILK
jgi:hypothetical protein